MNTKPARLFLAALAALVIAFLLSPAPAFAQVTTDSGPIIQADTAAAIATPFIVTLAIKFPWVLTVLAVMGGLRFFFKPIVSAAEAYVKSTPSTNDDELYAKATHSLAFKIIAWALDFFASVKVGPQFTAKPETK